MNYLHSQQPYPIIHRDLKCANIFIMSNTGDVKIGDFGLSTLMQGKMQTSVLGTPEYMAPEVYKGSYNTKIDIYSFGMCVIEMCTKKSPYYECGSQASIYKKVISGELPAGLSQINNQETVEFIKLCLLPAEERPTAEDLLLNDFLTIHEEDDRVHQPLALGYSPKSNKSSISSTVSQIEISLIINDNGKARQISFSFNLDIDTPEMVAEEMVSNLGLSKSYIVPVAKEIEVKLENATNLKAFPYQNIPEDIFKMNPKLNESAYTFLGHDIYNNEEYLDISHDEKNASPKTGMKTIRSENDIASMNLENCFISLKKGIDNDRTSVKKLQLALANALNSPVKIDGFFGKKVEGLVKIFQEKQKLKPDGIVTKAVWDKLLAHSPTSNFN